MTRYPILLAIATLLLCFIPQAGWSDEISDLKDKVKEVEGKNSGLQEQLDKQREATERLLKKTNELERADQALSKEVQSLEEKSVRLSSEKKTDYTGSSIMPTLKINGFWDMGFTDKMAESDHSKTFAIGELDLFLTSQISESVSFVSESVFYPFQPSNRLVFELQRILVKYSLSDLFNLQIGRMHTALGYWNHAYHHGTWLQTTISRPEVYRFDEYDNGILPIHSVGAELFGAKELVFLNVEYHLGVTNGRGRTISTIQNFRDENDSKAVSALLSLKPHFIEGLQFGANLYLDKIPSNPDIAARKNPINERIVGTHLAYLRQPVELLGELFKIEHHDETSGRDFDTLGFYTQGGFKIDQWTPYYRFDRIDMAEGDPYFGPDQVDITKHTVGLRWDPFTWNAIKFEYGMTHLKNQDREHSFSVNSSMTF